jgi:subfamily B ATP-binding cassette protein HlyB/CyaB
MQASEGGLEYQEVVWLLGSLCGLYRIPFDPKLVEQDFPPPHSLATFHEAARALGFKTGHSKHPANWQKLPLPAIAFLRAVPETASEEAVPTIPVLILKTDGHKLLYFRAGSQAPETITVDATKGVSNQRGQRHFVFELSQ